MDTTTDRRPPSASWERRVRLSLLGVFVVGLVVAASVFVVQRTVLDSGTYRSALADADAYERVYTEVLADPELAELTDGLLGRLGVGPTLSVQARALLTNSLRWAVPPSAMRAGTESLLDAVMDYLRGGEALDLDVDVSAVLDRVDVTAAVEARTLLASAAEQVATTVEAYRAAVLTFTAELASGRVPDFVPVLGGTTHDPAVVIESIFEALGPRVDDQLRLQVTAAVLADEQRDALVTAAADLVVGHAEAVADGLRTELPDGRRLDIVAEIDEHAQRRTDAVADSLGTARRLARWGRPLVGIIAALVVAAAATAFVRSDGEDRRRAVYQLAAATALGGMATLFLWWLVGRAVAAPLDRATGTGPNAWGLPIGLRSVLVDVRAAVRDQLAATVWSAVAVLGVTGLLVAACVWSIPRLSARSGRGPLVRRLLPAAATAMVLLVIGTMAIGWTNPTAERACNGHPELCERRYDEVVYAATHNSMSSPDVVQVWPEHDGDLRSQLDAGVRALLIDTHYWTPLTSPVQLTALDPLLPPALAESLYRISAPYREGREGTFLCHNHCAFGGQPLVDGLTMVRQFLDENADEVVTLIVQDGISTPDTEEAMQASGLDGYLFDQTDDEWPTLGELIDRDKRLVVFAEEAGPPPAWYGQAFEEMQETPFLFLSPEQFSCVPNRGRDDAELFLLNHWVQRIAPDRADSAQVNTVEEIVSRAHRCEAERGLRPNFVAVNHYNIGDVMGAVDILNGLTS